MKFAIYRTLINEIEVFEYDHQVNDFGRSEPCGVYAVEEPLAAAFVPGGLLLHNREFSPAEIHECYRKGGEIEGLRCDWPYAEAVH